ncbi:MAG: hypothetical protein Q7W05_09205 [Deltaproteobacteria bacterium]|nr:hypothetical protein [Deltaproteobacteria bacterium]
MVKLIIIPLVLLLCGCSEHFVDKTQSEQKQVTDTSSVKTISLDENDYVSFCYFETTDVKVKVSYYKLWRSMDSLSHRFRHPKKFFATTICDTVKAYIENKIDSLDVTKIEIVKNQMAKMLRNGNAKVFDKRNNTYVNSIIVEQYYNDFNYDECPFSGRKYYFLDGELFLTTVEAVY